jgi:hypothetical protein
MALDEVILDAIITAKHHGRHQAKHFFGSRAKSPFRVSIGIQVEYPFYDLVILS